MEIKCMGLQQDPAVQVNLTCKLVHLLNGGPGSLGCFLLEVRRTDGSRSGKSKIAVSNMESYDRYWVRQGDAAKQRVGASPDSYDKWAEATVSEVDAVEDASTIPNEETPLRYVEYWHAN